MKLAILTINRVCQHLASASLIWSHGLGYLHWSQSLQATKSLVWMRIAICFIILQPVKASLPNTVRIILLPPPTSPLPPIPSPTTGMAILTSMFAKLTTCFEWKVLEKCKTDLTPFWGFLWLSTFLEISQLFKRIMQSQSLQQQKFGISDPEGPSSPVLLEAFPSHTKDARVYLCGLNITPSIHTLHWSFLLHLFNRVEGGESLGPLRKGKRKHLPQQRWRAPYKLAVSSGNWSGHTCQKTPQQTQTASSFWPWDPTSRSITCVTTTHSVLDLPSETPQLVAVMTVVLRCRHLSIWN